MPRTEADEVAIARAHEIGQMLEDALYKTFKAADARPSSDKLRNASIQAWADSIDKIIDFAMED